MQDLLTMIAMRRRPPLLVRAARFGLDSYNRKGRLPRILNCGNAPRIGEAIVMLLEREADLEDRRASKAADYTIASHVDVLTALLGEARLLRQSLAPRVDTACADVSRVNAAPETKIAPQTQVKAQLGVRHLHVVT